MPEEKQNIKHPALLEKQEMVDRFQKGLAASFFGIGGPLPRLKVGYAMAGGKISHMKLMDKWGSELVQLRRTFPDFSDATLAIWLEEIVRRCNHPYWEYEKKGF